MTISFEAGTTIALGYPRSVAVADVNADGTADLVVLNGDTVDVLLGTGGGGFAAPIATSDFGDDVALDSLAVGDLNGDGLPDVAVSSEYGGVFVSFGNGSGGFGAPVTLVPNDYIGSLIVADLNGQTDLVGTTNGGVVVIPEDGQGNFGAPAFIAAGGSEDEQVVAADLTGNGLTDLVVVDDGYYSNGDVVVLLNDGSGGFAAPVTYAAGTNPDSVAVADVNGDGIPDLVVGDENSGGVEVLLGDGQGGFAAATNSDSDTFRSDVLLGDLSGDGTPDIASTAYFGYDNDENAVAVFPGDGSGGFDPPVIVPAGYDPQPHCGRRPEWRWPARHRRRGLRQRRPCGAAEQLEFRRQRDHRSRVRPDRRIPGVRHRRHHHHHPGSAAGGDGRRRGAEADPERRGRRIVRLRLGHADAGLQHHDRRRAAGARLWPSSASP